MALEGVLCPNQSLQENYQDLYLTFTFSDAVEATHNFNMPKMIQATFYAMVVNNALELGVMSRDMAEALKSALEGLWWFLFESWLRINKHDLLGAQFRTQADPRTGLGPAGGNRRTRSQVMPCFLPMMMSSYRFLVIACFFVLLHSLVRLACIHR